MFDKVKLRIVVENAAELANSQITDPGAFAMIRRGGFGASDASVLLGVNPWNGLEDLINQKCSTVVTEEELKIGLMPTVRMGTDLEGMILSKFEAWYGEEVNKPAAMYEIIEFPYLRVNFDGLTEDNIPVEIKTVSIFGEKHWDKPKGEGSRLDVDSRPFPPKSDRFSEGYLRGMAEYYGVPPQYYPQVQQQILAANAEYAYLAALFVKDWTLRVYRIRRDQLTINKLIEQAYQNWKIVTAKKGM